MSFHGSVTPLDAPRQKRKQTKKQIIAAYGAKNQEATELDVIWGQCSVGIQAETKCT